MAIPAEQQSFVKLAQRLDPQSRLLRIQPLAGGVSARVTVLDIEQADGRTHHLLVRQHGEVDRQQNPDVAADEFRLLQLLHAAGLPVPKPYYLDQSGEIFPEPYVVVEYIVGETEFAPADQHNFLEQLATHLAHIHKVNGARYDLSFLPQQGRGFSERPELLDESINEGRIRDILEAMVPVMQKNPPVLLHGDFWPGNILWRNGRVVGIIDWEDARIGDPLVDLANMRLELALAFNIDAAYRFTADYLAHNPIDYDNLAYWDLCMALRPAFKLGEWAADSAAEQRMRAGHQAFVAQAIANT